MPELAAGLSQLNSIITKENVQGSFPTDGGSIEQPIGNIFNHMFPVNTQMVHQRLFCFQTRRLIFHCYCFHDRIKSNNTKSWAESTDKSKKLTLAIVLVQMFQYIPIYFNIILVFFTRVKCKRSEKKWHLKQLHLLAGRRNCQDSRRMSFLSVVFLIVTVGMIWMRLNCYAVSVRHWSCF